MRTPSLIPGSFAFRGFRNGFVFSLFSGTFARDHFEARFVYVRMRGGRLARLPSASGVGRRLTGIFLPSLCRNPANVRWGALGATITYFPPFSRPNHS